VDKISLPFRIVLVVFLVFGRGSRSCGPRPPATSSRPPHARTGRDGLATATDKAKAPSTPRRRPRRPTKRANAVGDASTATKPSSTSAKRKPRPPRPPSPATRPRRQAGRGPGAPRQARRAAKPVASGLAADAAPATRRRPLLAAVDAGKVAVVLFWNKNAPTTAPPARPRAPSTCHGKVVASAVPLEDVGRYEAITRGAGPRVADRARHRRRRQGPRDHRLHRDAESTRPSATSAARAELNEGL
jgi:hypothetical protein